MKETHVIVCGVIFVIYILLYYVVLWYSFSCKPSHKNTKSKRKRLTRTQINYVHLILKQRLRIFTQLLDKHGYAYFVIGGTLLGCVREGDIIPHDDDVDIGMLEKDLRRLHGDKIFKDEMAANNLKFGNKNSPIAETIICRECDDGIFIDLFSFVRTWRNKYKFKKPKSRRTWKNSWFHSDELYPLRKSYLGNVLVSVPNDPIPFLARHYGQDWRTPRVTHTHNVRLPQYIT